MLNTLKYALAAVSTVIAGGYVAQQTEAPAPKTQVPIQYASFITQQDMSRRVSLEIDGTFADVVKWLKGQNIDFVIADDSASSRRIALNMQDKPLRDVLNAVARAMGGAWNVENGTYVFQPGSRTVVGGPVDMKNFKWDVPDVQVFSGQEMKALPGFDKNFMKEFKVDGKGMKVWVDGKEMDMKDLQKDGKFRVFSGEDMKALPGFDKNFMKEFKGMDGKGFQVWVDGKGMDLKEMEKSGKFKVFSGEDMKNFMKEFKGPDGKSFKFMTDGDGNHEIRVWVNGKEVTPRELKGKGGIQLFQEGKMDEKTRKQVEEAMKAAQKELKMYQGDKALSEAQRKEVENAMKKAHEAMAESMKTFDKAKIEKMIAEAQKENGNRKLTDQERKEVEAAMKQARRAMEEARGQMNDPKIKEEIARAMKSAKISDEVRKEMEIDMKRAHEDMAKAKIDMEKANKEMGVARLHSRNMKKLLDSLTPAQWELSKKQGYLKFSDLTDAQRKLFGDMKAGDDMTFSYSVDGKKITIKGK